MLHFVKVNVWQFLKYEPEWPIKYVRSIKFSYILNDSDTAQPRTLTNNISDVGY